MHTQCGEHEFPLGDQHPLRPRGGLIREWAGASFVTCLGRTIPRISWHGKAFSNRLWMVDEYKTVIAMPAQHAAASGVELAQHAQFCERQGARMKMEAILSEQIPDNGFDDEEDGVTAALLCHIEMDTKNSRTPRAAAMSTADTLRKLAKAIEAGFFDSGHHPITLDNGEVIGELYLDFYGEA